MENQNQGLEAQGADQSSETNIALASLESVDLDNLKPSFSLIQEYLKIKEGERVRGVFSGVTFITLTDEDTGETKELEAIRLICIEEGAKKMKIHAGANLVGNLKRSGISAGQPIEIFFKKTEKNGAKTINIFDVFALS